MDREMLSVMPIEDLLSIIQQDPENASLASDVLLTRVLDELKRFPSVRVMLRDDDGGQDVLIVALMKIWQKLPTFEYWGDKRFRNWLLKILENTYKDHLRRQRRLEERVSSVSLNDEILFKDGGTVELIETIPSDLEEDLTDLEQRELVIEVAEQCLDNEKQLELLKRRMLGQPLPPEWNESWINTNWHRIRKKLEKAFRERVFSG